MKLNLRITIAMVVLAVGIDIAVRAPSQPDGILVVFCAAAIAFFLARSFETMKSPVRDMTVGRIEKDVSARNDITTHKKIEMANAQFAAIVESSNDAIIGKTLDGTITSWNPAAELLFGYTAAEAIGRPVTMLFPPEQIKDEAETLARLARGERVHPFETIRLRKDGTSVDVSITISPIRNNNGDVIGASKIARDITDRTRLLAKSAESEERTRLAAMIGHLGVWDWDLRTNAVAWDKQMFDIHGFSPTADGLIPYTTWANAVAPDELAQQESILRNTIAQRGRSEREFHIRRYSDGAIRAIQAAEMVVCDKAGFPIRLIGVNRDITETLRLQLDLKAKNREMEDFVYTVSHDLKSPIVTTLGYLGCIREDLASGDIKEVHKSLGRLEGAAKRMEQSINDLLELSRIGRIPLNPLPINMAELFETLTLDLASALKAAGATLSIPSAPMPPLIADPIRIREVFENLITNAIKYGCDGPDRTITIGVETVDDQPRFFVRDHGPGIDSKFHEKIFALFQRLHGNEKPGSGIGLSIVRRIMELHQGSVRVDSKPRQGATFWVVFPRQINHESNAKAA